MTSKHVTEVIPLSAPEMKGNEWAYVKECLDTNWVSSAGSFVDRFEDMVSAYVGTGYSIATVNGTAALHVALKVAGIEPDEEVLVSDLTFIAPVNAIRYVGAYPVFIDAEPEFWQMDVNRVSDFLSKECSWKRDGLQNKKSGRRVRAVVPVHLLGHPVDVDPLLELARMYELVVIEDASESLGAKYKGKPVGSLGHMACFSFNGNKIITSGGGGMIVTNDAKWAQMARYLTNQARDDAVEYVHNEIGFNYRLTNVQAAIGVAQMERLGDHVCRKRGIAQSYREALKSIPGLRSIREADWALSTFWLYTVAVEEHYPLKSRDLLDELASRGIETRPVFRPIHLNKPYEAPRSHFPVAEQIYAKALSLPCSVSLTTEDQSRVIDALKEISGI
ncbi:MAG: LegC family aminotransferase [Pseudomonadota bacterium]